MRNFIAIGIGVFALVALIVPAVALTPPLTTDASGEGYVLNENTRETLQGIVDVLSGGSTSVWLGRIIELFGLFVVGAVLLVFTRGFSLKTIDNMERNVGKNFLYGFAGVIVTPFLLFLVFLTLIGIPLALFLFALWIILLFYGMVFAAIWIGRELNRRLFGHINTTPFWQLVIGGTVFIIVFSWLPGLFTGDAFTVVNGITVAAKLFFILWAAGAAIQTKREAIAKGYN